MTDRHESKGTSSCCSTNHCETKQGGSAGIWWWAALVVAVLAVPSFGFIASLLIPSSGIGTLVVFVLACWFCTYLGMRLMQLPHKK